MDDIIFNTLSGFLILFIIMFFSVILYRLYLIVKLNEEDDQYTKKKVNKKSYNDSITQNIFKNLSEAKNMKKKIVLLVIGFILIITLFMSCTTVKTGHTGILTTFGRVEETTYNAGVCFHYPFQKVVQIDNRVQINGHDDKPIFVSAFSKDIQEVKIQYTINYKIDKKNASKLYKEIGNDYFIKVLSPAIQESVKVYCAKYTADELVSNRAVFAQEIEKDLIDKFKDYYIDLIATNVEDLDFSDIYTNAVEAKQVAVQNKLKAQQEAEQKKVEADANAYAKVAEAEAEAKANDLRQKTLTDLLVKDKMIDKWNGVLPQVEGGSTPIISLK